MPGEASYPVSPRTAEWVEGAGSPHEPGDICRPSQLYMFQRCINILIMKKNRVTEKHDCSLLAAVHRYDSDTSTTVPVSWGLWGVEKGISLLAKVGSRCLSLL